MHFNDDICIVFRCEIYIAHTKFEVQTFTFAYKTCYFNNSLGQMEHAHNKYIELMLQNILKGFDNFIE